MKENNKKKNKKMKNKKKTVSFIDKLEDGKRKNNVIDGPGKNMTKYR